MPDLRSLGARALSVLSRRTLSRRALAAALPAVLAGAALSAAACNDFLDPEPEDVLAPENFYQTSADAVAAVNSVYNATRGAYFIGFWFVSDIATDDILASPTFGDGPRLDSYGFDGNDWWVNDIWTTAYVAINRANAVLDRVPATRMDAALRARLVAEARFLRALSYFNLVRYYGDVPLVTAEVKSLTGLDVPRAPAAEVYALVVGDLRAAAAALPATYPGADAGRATSGAARALLAKVYLTQKDWSRAAQTAGEVMAGGRYALLPVWKDNFRIATELTNSESVFEINYDATLDPGNGSIMTLFSLPANYPGGDAYGLMTLSASLVRSYAPGDVRGNNGTFMTSPHTDRAGRTVTWQIPAGPAFNKYLDETDAQNMQTRAWVAQSNNWIVLRYADVLLMYAEAVAEGGPASAGSGEAALNLVRARAGLPAVSGLAGAALRDSVRTERRREFVFEGQRWFDLSRWGQLDAAVRGKQAELNSPSVPVRGVRSSLLPIPQRELDANPRLTQNEGW